MPEVVSKTDDSYYAYLDPDVPETYFEALEQLDAFVTSEGPFDAIMAFSQGAGLAILYLAREKLKQAQPFKCAVLFAPTCTGDIFEWEKTGEKKLLKSLPGGEKIDIPVALIWGERDGWREEFESGSSLFDAKGLWQFYHAGGHEVPGPNVEGSLRGAIKTIRRATTQADLGPT